MSFDWSGFGYRVLNLAKQPSTWRGAIMVSSAFGLYVNPEIATQIVQTGMGVAGLIGMFISD